MINDLISAKEMIPWLEFASAIIKRAKSDLDKPKYREDAEWFLEESEYGQYLQDSLSYFEKILNKNEDFTFYK